MPMQPCATAGSISSGSIGAVATCVEAQPAQAGHGEEGGLGDPVLELLHPGLHVAAELDHREVRAAVAKLRPPPQAGGADDRAGRKVGERAAVEGDEGVAHVLARQVAGDREAVRLERRHVLHRMHGDVDLAGEQRVLDLAREQALAADLRQRPVEHPVAGGLDHDDLEGGLGQVVRGHQARARLARLGERQRAAARADAQRPVRRGRVDGHRGRRSLFIPDFLCKVAPDRSQAEGKWPRPS